MLHYGKHYQNQVHINKMQWRPPADRAVNTYLAVIGSLKYLRKSPIVRGPRSAKNPVDEIKDGSDQPMNNTPWHAYHQASL